MKWMRLLLALLLGVAVLSAGFALWSERQPVPLASLRVEVLNGCGTDGLAGDVARVLRELEQEVVRVDDADHHEYEQTILIDRRARPVLTRRLAERLGGLPVLLERVEGSTVDVTLILGSDAPSLDILTSSGGVIR